MFIPKDKQKDYADYLKAKEKYRVLEKRDAGKLNAELLILETRGNPPWDSFQGFRFDHADIGLVGNKMTDIYLIGERLVVRFKRQNAKYLIKR